MSLNRKNCPTWKIKGLWGIVSGTEDVPAESNAEAHGKYMTRKNRVLANIVLAVDPLLLFLLGNPKGPAAVWRKLEEQFQRKPQSTNCN